MRISFDSAAKFYDKTRGPPGHVMEQLVKTLSSELSSYRTISDARALLITPGVTTPGTYIEDVKTHSQNWKAQPNQYRRFFHKLYVGERPSKVL